MTENANTSNMTTLGLRRSVLKPKSIRSIPPPSHHHVEDTCFPNGSGKMLVSYTSFTRQKTNKQTNKQRQHSQILISFSAMLFCRIHPTMKRCRSDQTAAIPIQRTHANPNLYLPRLDKELKTDCEVAEFQGATKSCSSDFRFL